MFRLRKIIRITLLITIGIFIGGYLFSGIQPRSPLALHRCQETCFKSNEVLGLLASIEITKFPLLTYPVVLETDKTIVIKHPFPYGRVHFVIIPKKDIKNIGEISEKDQDYLIDIFSVVSELVQENNLTQYELITNGPGKQSVTYLHFHLISK